MSNSEINALLSQTDDPQVLSAVMRAPTAFPYGDDTARGKMLTNCARAHTPERVAPLNDCKQLTDALQNVRDALLRKVRNSGRWRGKATQRARRAFPPVA